jgi:hypothetical protein
MAKLSDYLLKVSSDEASGNPEERARFRRGKISAKRSMKAAGLSDDQIEAVLSGDSSQVREQLIAELGEKRVDELGLAPVANGWVEMVAWAETDPDA